MVFFFFIIILKFLLECFVFRLQEADLGFVVVIDRRNDKWSSVRCVLLRLAVSQSHVIFVFTI